eukprot:7866487-Heterocapsa_arctica.AAC.1
MLHVRSVRDEEVQAEDVLEAGLGVGVHLLPAEPHPRRAGVVLVDLRVDLPDLACLLAELLNVSKEFRAPHAH